MNEELQKALSALLSKANNGIDTAGEFLASELPDVIQQLLMWHGVYSFIMFITGIVALSLLIPTLKFCNRITKKARCDYDSGEEWTRYSKGSSVTSALYDFNGGVYLLVIAQFVIAVVLLNLKWLQIWIAPKVWLIEYAAKLTS